MTQPETAQYDENGRKNGLGLVRSRKSWNLQEFRGSTAYSSVQTQPLLQVHWMIYPKSEVFCVVSTNICSSYFRSSKQGRASNATSYSTRNRHLATYCHPHNLIFFPLRLPIRSICIPLNSSCFQYWVQHGQARGCQKYPHTPRSLATLSAERTR